jgi:hypothetical protein
VLLPMPLLPYCSCRASEREKWHGGKLGEEKRRRGEARDRLDFGSKRRRRSHRPSITKMPHHGGGRCSTLSLSLTLAFRLSTLLPIPSVDELNEQRGDHIARLYGKAEKGERESETARERNAGRHQDQGAMAVRGLLGGW